MLKAPYPYFGGKSSIAAEIWQRFGDVRNYVEPFFGSGAVLLNRPEFAGTETINDLDGMVSNFWRAVKAAPDEVANHADWPVNENDLHARHWWLVTQRESLQARLEGDADFFDAKAAGWWCWGMCCWIGSGWCSGKGPWASVDGQLVHLGNAGQGINRKLVHLGDAGQGINRKLVHLGDAGRGINWKLPLITNDAVGLVNKSGVYEWINQLSERLKLVRVCCGDWSRVCGDTPTIKQGETAVFLDPPYADTAKRTKDLYAHDCEQVAHAVRKWAIENGSRMRICLAGYEGEHEMPSGWEVLEWKARGGFGSQGEGENENANKERLWFSPRCLKVTKQKLMFTETA